MISYAKLWLLLNQKGMKRTDLLEIISSPTLAKLGKNENVSVEIIGKICDFLDCQPGDIMESIKREDIINAGKQFNEMFGQLLDMVTTATGKNAESLFEDFIKDAPAMLEKLKSGNTDYIGLQDFIDKDNDKRA